MLQAFLPSQTNDAILTGKYFKAKVCLQVHLLTYPLPDAHWVAPPGWERKKRNMVEILFIKKSFWPCCYRQSLPSVRILYFGIWLCVCEFNWEGERERECAEFLCWKKIKIASFFSMEKNAGTFFSCPIKTINNF